MPVSNKYAGALKLKILVIIIFLAMPEQNCHPRKTIKGKKG